MLPPRVDIQVESSVEGVSTESALEPAGGLWSVSLSGPEVLDPQFEGTQYHWLGGSAAVHALVSTISPPVLLPVVVIQQGLAGELKPTGGARALVVALRGPSHLLFHLLGDKLGVIFGVSVAFWPTCPSYLSHV